MQHRRLALPVAVVGSLGIALAPALAEASTSQTSTTQAAAVSAGAFHKAVTRTDFKSAVSHSVRAAAKAGANTAGADTSGPNPNLQFQILGANTSGHSVEVAFAISGLISGSATFTVDWGDGKPTSSLTATSTGQDFLSDFVPHTYATLGQYKITVTADDGAGDAQTASISCETGGNYTAYGPTRILDTRYGIGAATGPVASNGTVRLQVTGAGSSTNKIPTGISAVVLNVTAVAPTANGYLTAYGDDDASGVSVPNPGTSNLNFGTGQNVANLVTVPVGKDGEVDIYNGSKGKTQIVADIAGYYTLDDSAAKYVAISPARILDTRFGTGTGKVAKIPANGSITLTVAGSDGGTIPASGVNAVAMNLTVVGGSKNGVITAYPAEDTTVPTVSNLNYGLGQTLANMAIVPVGASGKVTFHNNSAGTVDLLADADGYYSTTTTVATASSYVPFYAPGRLVDTRLPGSSPLQTGAVYPLPMTDFSTETGEVFNATVVQGTGNGYLSLFPYNRNSPTPVPNTSNLNYGANTTVPNLAMPADSTTADSDGAYGIGVYLGGRGTAELILDWFGSFMDQ